MTTNQIVDGLLSGKKWYKGYLTYSFKDEAQSYEYEDNRDGITPLSVKAREAIHEIMSYASSLLGISITYSANEVGDIAIASKSMDELTLGYSYMPGSSVKNSAGDIFINSAFGDTDYKKGGMAYATVLHELGHALGLDHPFGDGEFAGITVNETIMSYNRYVGHDSFTAKNYSIYSYTSFQEADISALRYLYSAAYSDADDTYMLANELFSEVISGYTTPISQNIHTINDDGGNDTINLSGINGSSFIDLSLSEQSVVVHGSVRHYLNFTSSSIIENIVGSNHNDTFILNSAHNTIDAKGGINKVYINTPQTPRVDVLSDKIVVSSKESGFDTLKNISQLYINDELIDTSLYQRTQKTYTHEKAPEIARLYLSVFDRLADEAGLDYWVDDYTSGTSLKNIAASFVLSDEFASLYGTSQSNSEFIFLLYQNVLYRDADEAGLAYWLSDMQEGATKAELLASFSNSGEFSSLTQPYFQDSNIFLL